MSEPRYLADGRPMAPRSDFANGRHVPCGRFTDGGSKEWRRPRDGVIVSLVFYRCRLCDAAWIEEATP